MHLHVSQARRKACMRSHTATHLLHAQLVKIFPHTKQAGSLVDEDYLRFDFVADQFLSDQQIIDIEHNIQNSIVCDDVVDTQIVSKDDALKSGAKAFFQDKYGDEVRVVTITWDDDRTMISKELCGGTHVRSTGLIGVFKIVAQQAVASGVKRIVAYTWPKVYEYIAQLEQERVWHAHLLHCNPKQLTEKIQKLDKDYTSLKKSYDVLLYWSVKALFQQYLAQAPHTIQGISCYIVRLDDHLTGLTVGQLSEFITKLCHPGQTRVCIDWQGGYIIVDLDKQAKHIMQKRWIKWGGNEIVVQGKDSTFFSSLW